MAPPVPRTLRTLATLFAVSSILACGALALRLLAASREGWQLGSLDLSLLALDAAIAVASASGHQLIRRAVARAASGAGPGGT